MESKIALQDTCGVHSLHGMPGVFAAIVSMIYLCTLEGKGFAADYFYITDPSNYVENKGTATETQGDPGTYNDQAIAQLKSLLVTLAISITSGLAGGFLCSMDCFHPLHALFRDDDHFVHVLQKYPKHYLEISDESVEYAKQALGEIRNALLTSIPANLETKQQKAKWMGENVFAKHARTDQELNKQEVLTFFNEYIEAQKDNFEADDYNLDGLLPGMVFNKIFQSLDTSENGRVSKDEILDYFFKLIGENKTEGPNMAELELQDFKAAIN